MTRKMMMIKKTLMMVLMMTFGINVSWGATVTYHIINLGRLDATTGQPTSTRTEALQFTVTDDNVTVGSGIFDNYKSPLAKNWKYYSSNDVTYDSNTKGYTLGSPSLNVGDALSDGDHVYVAYELDEDAFSTVSVENGGIYRIKFPNGYYLRQDTYGSEINTSSSNVSNPTASEYLWKFNIVDPYQITIQSQSSNYLDYYLSSKTNKTNFADIRLQKKLADAQATKAWAFSLIPGGSPGTYRLIVADGITVAPIITGNNANYLDSFGHGYLNNNRKDNKTTYHLYYNSTGQEVNNTPYARCDLTIEFLSAEYTFHIINNSGEEAMKAKTASALNAGATITPSMIPDILKSPAACNYSFYPTAADAIAGTHELSSLPYSSANIYVRYNTSSSAIYFNGTIRYNLSVGGDHYLCAADATSIGSATTSGADDTYKWTLHGDDPYQFTIKNVDNSQYITYDVSGGEAAPTLSGTGSYFFLHQSTSGKYELVAIPSNNYPTSYYTLGYSTDGLKLYSSANHSFGADEIQTVFTASSVAVINPLPTANNRTYDGTTQNLVTAGVCEHGTVWYREGTTGEYVETIPTKKDAGTYHVYYMSVGNAGYDNYVAPDPIIVTIAPAPVTVTAVNKTKVYGEADPTLTYTSEGLFNGDAITGTLTRVAGENVGTYAITQGGLTAGNNYEISFTSANLTITKVGLKIMAKNHTITYGEAPTSNGVIYKSFVNSDTETALGGSLDYDFSYEQYGDVGNYTITPKGLTSDNYEITFVKGILTVNAKEVGLTWSEITSFPYDGSSHTLTATATGMVNGDEIGVTVTGAQTNAGNHTATASALTGDKAGNYKLPIANTQSYTVTPKSLGDGTTLADGYTLNFGEGNTILLKDDEIGSALVPSTDYSVGEDTDPSEGYSIRTVTGTGDYEGSFTVRNASVAFSTDTEQEGWSATFVAEKKDDEDIGFVLPEGFSAFIISDIRGEWAIPEPLNYIPADVPVLLVANHQTQGFVVTEASSSEVPITPDQKDKNMLKKVTEDTPDYDPDTQSAPFGTKQIYLLYKNEFVFNKAGNLKKGKVYLKNPNPTASSPEPAPARLQIAWNYTTGIEDGRGKIEDGSSERWYTLDGRCLSGKPTTKGLYIVNGKKTVIK